MLMTKYIKTPHLNLAYEEAGDRRGKPIVLVHGWPDDVRCWDKITPELAGSGYRVLAPYLRGCTPTTIHSAGTMRSGAIAALGQDLADFIDGLELRDVLVVGYDWGARAGYVVGALFSERVCGLLAMAAGYATSKPVGEMSYDLAKAYWYEWLVATKQGREAMDKDRRRLCRYLWQTWSPGWTFDDAEFEATAASWENGDWAPISIHAYLQRWGEAAGAPEHEELEKKLLENPPVRVPTIMLQGADDADNFPETSEDKEQYFASSYQRVVLPGVGHFIPREAPHAVLTAIRQLLSDAAASDVRRS
ncbi:Putative hydrolase (plasmid) [Neorhizobium galegae bv. officinalis bv. officinalis str. HAMBI 1141]|uniref:Putative hydrolase n=2 Tax=Neorhizobium galegae TaxID=399 RepID=A0A068THV1_NEOGA|nr:Putative hydrolase [Neorhizobium galegae bv. officinalis bv. officinalis str. HAMBI 1141]